ncbi:MAG TPA: phosphonate metabolism protein/1,5-bisphosphokinase (PRPP-forming) PhnN [Pseudomonas sp.]|jgi:ribose 1,5-bisphosphokinase|nr:phosphonate metabolism protein/1,5-bisphosphokinase (PRPP-forming) PhnN [Pseudomonas sp.]
MTGRLVYLIGPSGSGKDSLLRAAAEPLAGLGACIATRLITRPSGSVGEEGAIGLKLQEFHARRERGEFALCWQANDLDYGIPREIDDWLAAGRTVLVNGSRGHLQQARRTYPDLLPILLQVEEAVLRQRLQHRGRETPEQIEARLQRSRQMASALAGETDLRVLDNSGSLEDSVRRLLALIAAPSDDLSR